MGSGRAEAPGAARNGSSEAARGGGSEEASGQEGTPGRSPARGRRVSGRLPQAGPTAALPKLRGGDRAERLRTLHLDERPLRPRTAYPPPRSINPPPPAGTPPLHSAVSGPAASASRPKPPVSSPHYLPCSCLPTFHIPPAIKAGALGQGSVPSLLPSPRENFSKIFPESHCQGPEFPPLHLPSGCLQTSPWICSL